MNDELLSKLKEINTEERDILEGTGDIQEKLYFSEGSQVINRHKLLDKNCLIEVRRHTRFVDFPNHRHNYIEMIYMCSGSSTHIINETDAVLLEKGDILILNQNTSHAIHKTGMDDIAVNFIILPEFFDVVMKIVDDENVLFQFIISCLSTENDVADYLHFHVKDALPIQNIMENLIWTLWNKKPQTNTVNQVSVGLLFLYLQNFADTINRQYPTQHDQNIVFRALQYIRGNYKTATLEEFSDYVGIRPYTVSRILKKYAGCNFKQLLTDQKLSQAAYLLGRTSLSVENVLHAIGYENSSFFYNRFKDKYGMTPYMYRKSHPTI